MNFSSGILQVQCERYRGCESSGTGVRPKDLGFYIDLTESGRFNLNNGDLTFPQTKVPLRSKLRSVSKKQNS